MAMRSKRLTAIYLVIALLLSSVNVFGEEAVDTDHIEIPSETFDADIVSDVDGDPEETEVYSAIVAEVELLSMMEPGVDYTDREGVFLADSCEEALSVASEYDADLKSFEDGVAVVEFRESTVDTYTSAASSDGITRFIEPNILFELDDEIEEPFTFEDYADLDSAEEGVTEEDGAESGYAAAETYAESGSPAELTDVDEEKPDPYASSESGAYQYAHDKIHDLEAHKVADGSGIRIAVIDTGVNAEHEELEGVVSVNYISSVLSSFKDKRNAGKDYHGHGTHVCGVIAAKKNNGKGGYGIAPGVHIDSIQVSVTGSKFSLSDVALGVKKAIALSDKIINMSLGADTNNSVLREVLDEAYSKGILCVGAAGNKSSTDKRYPSSEDDVVAVAASTINGGLAYYSNYGDWVDIIAPGSSIYSTYLYSSSVNASVSKNRVSGNSAKNSYGRLSGTSQAVPVVSSVAALIYSANPAFFKEKTVDAAAFVREVMRCTSDGKEYCYNEDERRIVKGLVQADKAVNFVKDLKLSGSYSVIDSGGHYGPLLSGFLSKGKSIRLKLGSADGNADKNLLKSASWESTNPEKVTVKKGKVKCTKDAKAGDTAIISATIGSDTVYYVVTVQNKVKKMGVLDKGSYSFKSGYTTSVTKGVSINIATPNSSVSSSLVSVGFSTKKKELNKNVLDNTAFANERYKYKITIPKSAMKKISVNEVDKNGDPLNISIHDSGKINIKYKLLDGSNKTFTLKLKVG